MFYALDKLEYGIIAKEKKENTSLCLDKDIHYVLHIKKGNNLSVFKLKNEKLTAIFYKQNGFKIKKQLIQFASDILSTTFSSFIICSNTTLNISSKRVTSLSVSPFFIAHLLTIISSKKVEIPRSEVFYYQLKSGIIQFNRPPPFC